jgi:excisionase family DNA binding protein
MEKLDFVSVAEAAQMAQVAETTVRRWCREGYLKSARRIGKRPWLVPVDELEQMMGNRLRPGAKKKTP